MKLFAILFLSFNFLIQPAGAATKRVYSCTPVPLGSRVQKVYLDNVMGADYKLTILELRPDGSALKRVGDAKYGDDVTYFGYYSTKLDASLEFQVPEEPTAMLQIGNERIPVSCVRF